jgi:hypothetical protein
MAPPTKNLPTKEERVEIKQRVCMLSNLELQSKVDALLTKIIVGAASEKECREAAIIAEVIINRGNAARR